MLEIQHFSKSYHGQVYAVRDLSLRVNRGDIFGFIGHNGAGKTTTLKAAVGILEFTQGDIFIEGHSIRTDPIACKQRISYLPDTPEVYPYLKGIDYLNFIADVFAVPLAERNAAIDTYGESLDIKKHLGQEISSYSHGMKQKLSILAALSHRPRVLICDEPFVGLDPHAARLFKDIMRTLCDEGGCVLFSTHVLEVAEKLCNRVAIIQNGQLVACGNMAQVKGDASLEDVFLGLMGEM